MNRRIWKALGIAVCMLALAAPRAMAETNSHYVSNNEQFADAVRRINNESNIGDENEIVLIQDITLTGNHTLERNTTIKSEKGDHRIFISGSNAGITVEGKGTTLNLGAEGYAEKLTIDGNAKGAFITVSGGATANMYENVTLQNRQQVDQACVVLEENSVFNMHGGVIQNCKGKYGGVSLKNGSRFIMEGGTISGCEANAGGGLYADNSIVTINKGTISGCSAGAGGGLYATNSSKITINNGTISGCKAVNGYGGGLYAANNSTVTIEGGTISECCTTSDIGMGGGLYAYSSTITIGGGTIEKVWDMAKYVVAFEKWVKDEHLSMVASHYDGFAQGKAGVLDSMLIPAFSMLIKQGTACAVEGDMKVAMAMSILKTISGTGQLSEMYSIDFNDDICIIGHSGSGDADISDKKPTMKIVPVFHGKTGGGYLTQFYPYTGPVTYLAITQDGDGHFKFVVAEGVNEEGPILSFGDTNMRTRFTCGAREFVNRWSEAGPTHHMAAATGRHIDTILKVAKIFNIPVDIVTR